MAIKIAGVDVINDDRELVLAKLTDINSTISSTAVDVFIYDTSNDSDGGAWRHRTQHTSWYAEASSASRDANTRGSRKEFPAVAVIVAEASKVTIYDGDDPSLPMWMVFQINFNEIIRKNGGYDVTCAACLNGQLAVGVENANNGLSVVNFVSDIGLNWTGSGKSNYLGTIAERDDALGFSTANSSESIVNGIVNDVAMTVLPNAPTDPATGLPVPTIAVMTAGGISVIRHDGSVLSSSGSIFQGYRLAFDDLGGLYWSRAADAAVYYAVNPAVSLSTFNFGVKNNSLGNAGAGLPKTADNTIAYGANKGLARVQANLASTASAMVAYTTSSYNTGWMNGDIKLAALADTSAETLSDADALDDDFSSYADQAAAEAAGYSFANGCTFDATNNQVDVGASGQFNFNSASSIPNNSDVIVEVVVSNMTTGALVFQSNFVNINPFNQTNAISANGTYHFSCKKLSLRVVGFNSFDGSVDSISVRLADPDRSVNGKGLAAYGSITKAAVATGADVVAYSGFNSSNYLEQPYNSALDFGTYTGTAGTGDFCVMAWMKEPSGSVGYIFDRASSSGGSRWYVQIDSNGRISSNAMTVTSNIRVVTDSLWHHVCVFRKDGITHLYIDGTIEGTPGSNSLNIEGSNSPSLYVGVRYSLAQPIDGLALFRISATAPTADQIKKIYEDEKFLFQENAKATLYGTSDAVTALAHDPVTDLLHVGTSSGRSVFQGLRRVDNTTTAVSTAISANDSLIVEQ